MTPDMRHLKHDTQTINETITVCRTALATPDLLEKNPSSYFDNPPRRKQLSFSPGNIILTIKPIGV